MALRRDEKRVVVSKIERLTQQAVSVIATDYRGLSVQDMTELRVMARKKGKISFYVAPNRLTLRAVADSPFKAIAPTLKGPTMLVFSEEELGGSARLIEAFMKANPNRPLEVKGICLGGELLNGAQLAAVAKLPTREEALTRFVTVLQAPITKLVRTMAEPQAKLVRVLAAIRDKRTAEAA